MDYVEPTLDIVFSFWVGLAILSIILKSDGETQVLFEFIAHRYESGSLIITSNQPFSQWDHIFPDSMMTVAAIDRVIHHAHILEIEGESYRKKQHLKK